MNNDRPVRRQDIEDSTAARLAEIVAAAERAAKQVIDEAEEEARTRLTDAHEEADRIVAERLAGLAELTDEIDAQAEALRRHAEALQQAVAQAKAELGGAEAIGGSATRQRRETDRPAPRSSLPSLTVVGGAPDEEPEPTPEFKAVPEPDPDFESDLPPAIGGTPAGARLLATQMAVSGSSRDEIEARLRSGFEISDPGAILDAILGPEQ